MSGTTNQIGFSTLWDGFATDADAKSARDAKYRELKAQGHTVKRWVLRNQTKQYAGFGQPDGRSCDVYYVDVLRRAEVA